MTISKKKVPTIAILHIISGDLWAGAETQMFHSLCESVKMSRFSYAVLLFNRGILTKRLQDTGIKCSVIEETKYNVFIMIVKISFLLKRLNPKIIHVHAYKEHIFCRLACILSNNKAHIVRTFHGIRVSSGRGFFWGNIKSTLIHQIEKVFMRRCNLIAVSKNLEERLLLAYPNACITQIYNGIPAPQKEKYCQNQVRKKYCVHKNMFWIGAVARLETIKNLEMLIDAGKILKEYGLNFKISIFGEGTLKYTLLRKIKDNNLEDNVYLEGFVDDIMPIVSSFDVFVLCSLHEGLPMSLLEAMFLRVPVICTKVGGVEEVVTDRYSGLLVQTKDIASLSQVILELKKDQFLKKYLVENAKRSVETQFLITNTNKQLEIFYRNLTQKIS